MQSIVSPENICLHLLVTVAGLATAVLPISVIAAPGDLYEADFSSNTILKFTPDGTKSTYAAGLNGPYGLAFDGSGNLFEADTGSKTSSKSSPMEPRASSPPG